MIARIWRLAHGREIVLGERARIMGVLNVTPDSFSDGGRYGAIDAAVAQARQMIGEGADIVDVGGESTRPGAEPIDVAEEQRRVLPVIEALIADTGALVSVDTYHADTARLAVAAGAHIVNDIWGLQGKSGVGRIVAETGAGVVLMHNGRGRTKKGDVIDDQKDYLGRSLRFAEAAGIGRDRIVLDPGFGFAKEVAVENLELMARLDELAPLGMPLLVGTSRKRFIGEVTARKIAAERDAGTAATSVMLRLKGADLFRVHNVAINADALALADAMVARDGHRRETAAMYTIRMRNCAFFARHGVLAEEERLGQRFYIDATLTVEADSALADDDIAGTVDYGAAFSVIEQIVTGQRRFLIEALALEVAKALVAGFPAVARAEITVRKPNAPVAGVLDSVEVTVAWPR